MQHTHQHVTRRWQRANRNDRPDPASRDVAFQLDPNAPEFCPGIPDISTQTEFVQTLHELWSADAYAWEDEMPSTEILVWFVDHRMPNPKCYVPRAVRLFEDFSAWEQRILAAWSEFVQIDLVHEMTVVQPTPPRMEIGVAAHVMLVQSPRDHWSTSLVTVQDFRLGPVPLRIAITTTEHLTFEQVTRGVHYDDSCIHEAEPVHCQIWYQQLQLLPGHPIPCWTGYSLVLHVIRGHRPQPVQQPQVDTQVMLQTGKPAKPETREEDTLLKRIRTSD